MPHRRRATIAMVTYAQDVGGAERSLLTLAALLPAHDLDPVIICASNAMAEKAASAGLAVEVASLSEPVRVSRRENGALRYSPRAVARRASRSIRDAGTLARLVRRRGARLLYSNSLPSHLPAIGAGRWTHVPVVWHLREIVSPGPGRHVLSLMGGATAGIIAISDAVALSIRSATVVTIYNPVSAPPDDVSAPEWGFVQPLVGYVGRINERKGIEDVVRAVGCTSATLVIVGDDQGDRGYSDHLRSVASAAAPGRVHLVGAVADPWPAMSAFDMLVVPSREEPFGRVAAEGQRMGLPVIAAAAGGLPEIITHERDGLLYHSGDVNALSGCIQRLIEDPALGRRLGSTARATSERFDPERHAASVAAYLWATLEN